jgi:hypothetical protein
MIPYFGVTSLLSFRTVGKSKENHMGLAMLFAIAGITLLAIEVELAG